METLEANGVNYIKATVLAKRLHYTTDYIGQLCRQGKVEAKLVGRAWFVNETSFTDCVGERHLVTRSVEILSKNKLEFPVTDNSNESIAIYPTLSKKTKRQLGSSESGKINASWQNHLPIYSSDEYHLKPLINSLDKTVVLEPESEPVHKKVIIRNESKEPSHLAFTGLPTVSLRGDLAVNCLDTEAEYVSAVPVSVSDIEPLQAESARNVFPPIVATLPRNETASVEGSTITLKRPYSQALSPSMPTNREKSNFLIVPVLLLVSIGVVGTFFALSSRVVSDGTTLHQSVTFNVASVFNVFRSFP
jgi:hypothetical protein